MDFIDQWLAYLIGTDVPASNATTLAELMLGE